MNRLASPAQLRASLIRWALFLVPLTLLLGFGSSTLAGSAEDNVWLQALAKPAFYPPGIAFGIVWPILYVMMGLAIAGVCSAWGSRGRTLAIALYVAQFTLNLAWSPVFFAFHQIELAFAIIVVMDLLVIGCVIVFLPIRRWAALLMVPYLAWLIFATLLNGQIWQLNPDASSPDATSNVQRIEL